MCSIDTGNSNYDIRLDDLLFIDDLLSILVVDNLEVVEQFILDVDKIFQDHFQHLHFGKIQIAMTAYGKGAKFLNERIQKELSEKY